MTAREVKNNFYDHLHDMRKNKKKIIFYLQIDRKTKKTQKYILLPIQ